MATSRRDSSASPIFMHVEPVKGVLRTFTPDQLLRSYAKLQRLVRRAGNGFGHVKYDLTHCPIMDPGAMLLLWYVAGQLKRAGWTPWVGGEGSKAVQMFSRNFDHYLLPQKDPRRQVVAN